MKEWIAITIAVITMVAGGVYTIGYQGGEIAANKAELNSLQEGAEKHKDEYAAFVSDHKDVHAELSLQIVEKLNTILVVISTTKVNMNYIKDDIKAMKSEMKLMKRGMKF